MDVVVELMLDVGGGMAALVHHDLLGNLVGQCQVGGIARGADPAERTEAVVEEHRTHDILDVGRIAEAVTVGSHDVGTGA